LRVGKQLSTWLCPGCLYNRDNMSAARHHELFPIAMGNEEESMLLTGPDEQSLSDPTDFVNNFQDYIPANISRTPQPKTYLQNGSKMYDGGAFIQPEGVDDGINLERATPECSGPRELATYIQASERLYIKMLSNYVSDSIYDGEPVMARAHRRTREAYGNIRASHDNFEVRWPEWVQNFDADLVAKRVLVMHLITRSNRCRHGDTERGPFCSENSRH
jgi:hypothetical protein